MPAMKHQILLINNEIRQLWKVVNKMSNQLVEITEILNWLNKGTMKGDK